MAINLVALTGNLTRDAELRHTQTGVAVLNMGIAVNEKRKNAVGDWEDEPQFFDLTMFGNRADKVAQYLTRGTKVSIMGKLRFDQWEKDGQKRSKVSVIVNDIEFMSRREGTPNPQQGNYVNPAVDVYAEDIPF